MLKLSAPCSSCSASATRPCAVYTTARLLRPCKQQYSCDHQHLTPCCTSQQHLLCSWLILELCIRTASQSIITSLPHLWEVGADLQRSRVALGGALQVAALTVQNTQVVERLQRSAAMVRYSRVRRLRVI